jgi:hypothetical protein
MQVPGTIFGEQVPAVGGFIDAELGLHGLGDVSELESCDSVAGTHLEADHFLLNAEGTGDGGCVFVPNQGPDGSPAGFGVQDMLGDFYALTCMVLRISALRALVTEVPDAHGGKHVAGIPHHRFGGDQAVAVADE